MGERQHCLERQSFGLKLLEQLELQWWLLEQQRLILKQFVERQLSMILTSSIVVVSLYV
jgi:hypothetical protein